MQLKQRIWDQPPDWIWRLPLFLLLAALQGILFIGLQYNMTGVLSLPLDDSFIHFQYAKEIARGNYFQYQEMAGVTSGATSFLYAHVLAVGFWLGFDGNGIILWSHLLAWVSIALLLYWIVCLAENLYYPLAGWGTAVLVLCSGHLAWALWSGMEIALLAMLLAWVYKEAFNTLIHWPRLLLAMGLLALCRPEGQIISILLFALLILQLFWRQERSYIQTERKWMIPSALFFFLTLILPNLINRLMIGVGGSNGLRAKSLLLHPAMSSSEKIQEIVHNLLSLLQFFMADRSISPIIGEFLLPGLLLFVLLGLVGLVSHGQTGLWRALAIGLPLSSVLFGIATLEVWSLHSYRYIAPFIPVFMLVALIGVETTLHFWRIRDWVPTVSVYTAAALILLTFLPVWTGRYAEQSTTIYEKQGKAAVWISQQLPGSRPVAVNDAGALAYYGDKEIYDLVGLVTNETTLPYRMGEGSLYEEMAWLAKDQRPLYGVIFPDWFEEMAQIYDIFHQPLVTFPDPFETGFDKTVYHLNWSYVGMETQPRQRTMHPGWVVKDFVDVADLRSEETHDYRLNLKDEKYPEIVVPFRRNFGYHEEIEELWPDIENEQEYLIPQMKAQGILNQYDIVDAGRRIEESEEFTLSGLTERKDAYLILRTCETSGERERFNYSFDLFVDDIFVGDWQIEGTPWNWYESVFTIPAEFIQDSTIRVRVVNRGTLNYTYYDSYYYWICQKEELVSVEWKVNENE